VSWDVRSNIKAKPGSQGTLFQGGSDQMTAKKWPRGYTPERLHEVKSAALPDKRILADEPHMYPFDTNGEKRKLVDNIARSTVPVHHLLGVQFEPGQTSLAMSSSDPHDPAVPGGLYEQRSGQWGGHATIKLHEGVAARPTAIHEIGHHVSQEQGTPHRAYDTTPKRGQEEAFADNYAQTHYRPRRSERYLGVGMYNGGDTDHVRTEEFFKAYHAHRDYEPVFGKRDLTPPSPPGSPNPRPTLPGLERYGKRPWL
jgi:hypothetical protein